MSNWSRDYIPFITFKHLNFILDDASTMSNWSLDHIPFITFKSTPDIFQTFEFLLSNWSLDHIPLPLPLPSNQLLPDIFQTFEFLFRWRHFVPMLPRLDPELDEKMDLWSFIILDKICLLKWRSIKENLTNAELNWCHFSRSVSQKSCCMNV